MNVAGICNRDFTKNCIDTGKNLNGLKLNYITARAAFICTFYSFEHLKEPLQTFSHQISTFPTTESTTTYKVYIS